MVDHRRRGRPDRGRQRLDPPRPGSAPGADRRLRPLRALGGRSGRSRRSSSFPPHPTRRRGRPGRCASPTSTRTATSTTRSTGRPSRIGCWRAGAQSAGSTPAGRDSTTATRSTSGTTSSSPPGRRTAGRCSRSRRAEGQGRRRARAASPELSRRSPAASTARRCSPRERADGDPPHGPVAARDARQLDPPRVVVELDGERGGAPGQAQLRELLVVAARVRPGADPNRPLDDVGGAVPRQLHAPVGAPLPEPHVADDRRGGLEREAAHRPGGRRLRPRRGGDDLAQRGERALLGSGDSRREGGVPEPLVRGEVAPRLGPDPIREPRLVRHLSLQHEPLRLAKVVGVPASELVRDLLRRVRIAHEVDRARPGSSGAVVTAASLVALGRAARAARESQTTAGTPAGRIHQASSPSCAPTRRGRDEHDGDRDPGLVADDEVDDPVQARLTPAPPRAAGRGGGRMPTSTRR